MKKAARGGAELESIEARLEDMERRLDRLRTLYESFFMGVERTPPNTPRRDLNRMMLEMQQVPIGNATARFRFQSLLQRWVQLTTYWNRTMREMEAGTYRRDLARAQRHIASRSGAMTETEALALGIPSTRVKAFVERQHKLAERRGDPAAEPPRHAGPHSGSGPAEETTRTSAPPARSEVPGLTAGEFDAFYDRFVAAHREAAGMLPQTSKEQLRTRLQQDLPRLLGQGGGKVTLDVSVENGKVRLKARPAR
ncbi:MAG TPA: MXAN_5187 C-terminal domain-containing protein [Polyangia bacterium]